MRRRFRKVIPDEKKIRKGNTVPVEMKIQKGDAGEKKIHKVIA